MAFKPTSLRQRTTLYILLPTCILLLTLEILSFRNIREMLLHQLEESATSHLQRTATYIDSRLKRPKNMLRRLQAAPSREVREYILDNLTTLEGVVEVNPSIVKLRKGRGLSVSDTEDDTRWNIFYPTLLESDAINLTVESPGNDDSPLPVTKVTISFYDLIGHIPGAPWWTGLRSFMIDNHGNTLSPDIDDLPDTLKDQSQLYSLSPSMRQKLLTAVQNDTSGTVTSDDRGMPETIYGFYKLTEAPWTLVVRSQGETVLQPIISFRKSYFFVSILTTALILYLINLLTTRTIRTVRQVSNAATRLAEGHFDQPLELSSNDELGELVRSFNTMNSQLQQGVQLKKAMAIAGEVQRNLLPQSQFNGKKLAAFGVSVPCDETGGDFFDIVNTEENAPQLTVVVGDVVGHGIGAALLMATTRALLRGQISSTVSLSDCVSSVNRLLCRDTEPSGNFVTIFLLAIDKSGHHISWVRAGHEPAMLYNLKKNEFSDLKGRGLALGVDPNQQYQENSMELAAGPHLIITGTDGVTDVENEKGDRFGRERLQSFIESHSDQSPESILQKLCMELERFRGDCRQNDDITLVIAKTA
ncbi:MAG: SpoIIE family protein phosphatase [Desulforhopalus sp.]